jgi:hypothetical protein
MSLGSLVVQPPPGPLGSGIELVLEIESANRISSVSWVSIVCDSSAKLVAVSDLRSIHIVIKSGSIKRYNLKIRQL